MEMNNKANRVFTGLCLVTVVLSLGFVSLFRNESELLNSDSSLVLTAGTSYRELSDTLQSKGIYRDPNDADCIARWIMSNMNGPLSNLGALNKKQFMMPADTVFGQPLSEVAGEKVRLAVETSRARLGVTPQVSALYGEVEGTGLETAQLIRFDTDDVICRRQTGHIAGDTVFTKVTVRVMQTQKRYDTLTVDSKGFRYGGLCRIPYIGRRVADKILTGMKQSEKNQEGVPGVLVRVRDHSVNKSPGDDLGYIMTGSTGEAVVYLPGTGFYSFLPVREGFEYGASKGTRRGALGSDDVEYSFRQKRHTVRPVDMQTYMRIKEDHILSVRSAVEYKNALLLYPFLFIAAWWLLFIFLARYDRRHKTQTDYLVPLALMSISGIGLLAMFSIVNPLTDTFLGSTMTVGAIAGIFVMALVSCIDWGFFYSAGIRIGKTVVQFDFVLQFIRWVSVPFMEKVQSFKIDRHAGFGKKTGYFVRVFVALLLIPLELLFRLVNLIAVRLDGAAKKLTLSVIGNPNERLRHWARSTYSFTLPKGFGYVIIVLFLIVMLQLFGDGPEGSGTKVNLFFFQPSELNKYLVVVFMAAFFAVRADRITLFSEVSDSLHLRLQFRTVLLILLSLAALLVLYMVVMSDMGPALVLIVTFIFIYSIARKDFKQLLIGIATFLGMIWLGGAVNEGSLTAKFIFALGWLVGWVVFWRIKDKRLYESAIFFNFLLSAFIFLGNFLADSDIDVLRSVGQRIVDRNEVAMHLWDNSVQGGGDQVVQGIWSLATGGLAGQGLGQGNPNLVPAFHTDMIFTSIGEEMGWISLLLIVLCLAVIIHRSLVIAYRSGNRFLFFLTSGIAVVTGVQFFVIILGSIGIIPLTGVAVPFLSFGMTSLIINLAAFGIVISVSRTKATRNQREVNRPYAYVTAVGIGSFLAVSAVLAGILFHYQVLPSTRNRYLIRPAYVSNDEGLRLAEYNPRIRLLLKEMNAGNILDRNRLLLATSDRNRFIAFVDDTLKVKSQALYDAVEEHLEAERYRVHSRYYPFGDNTFFVLGDFNTQTLWGIDDDNPYGFFAEERLLGELRGFTTALTDGNGRPVKVELESGSYYPSPFALPTDTCYSHTVRDYKPLLKYLKNGIHGRKVGRYNDKTEKGTRDVYLTIDAKLQTLMQTRMNSYLNSKECSYNTASRPKLRASAVVLSAENGDVLTSSTYPLPNQDSIRKYQDLRIDYSKYEREWSNPVFTDRDLGATYLTNPGSTAKLMSSAAGFMKYGTDIAGQEYNIDNAEIIHSVVGSEPIGRVSMQQAIVESSNCYFINLVNDRDLYCQLETLYMYAGAKVGQGESHPRPAYFLYEGEIAENTLRQRWNSIHSEVENMGRNAVDDYNRYLELRAEGQFKRMNREHWMWPWGQGTLDASPMAMARVASMVYNGGVLPETHWIYARGKAKHPDYYEPTIERRILTEQEAEILKQYMKDESANHAALPASMGGKTGTPGRDVKFSFGKEAVNVNDGWYVCFVDAEPMPLAIGVRLERVGINADKILGGGSGLALDFVRNVVIPSLSDSGYIIKTDE